ncbi:hypothetical protein BH23PSE1_BH23PSE1_11850 [soil metagenome]
MTREIPSPMPPADSLALRDLFGAASGDLEGLAVWLLDRIESRTDGRDGARGGGTAEARIGARR